MRRTENLNLPIYDNPESDIFKINDINNAHETIDKQYKELKDIKEAIESTNPSANLQEQINDINASLDNIEHDINTLENYYNILKNTSPINILDLGAKNDGSEDISDIINEHTSKYPIFLPCGIYKISKPITLKNSIIGSGYSRNQKVTNEVTWLISDIQDGSLITVTNNSVNENIRIENLSIKLNGNENGIEYNATNLTMLSINSISVINVGSKAIFLNSTKGVTRTVFANNVTILGRAKATSIGVYVGKCNYDCRFTNIEIMGTQIGLDVYEIFYGSNIHIWTGSMSGEDNDNNWWNQTVGIRATGKAKVRLTNIYLDSCHILFVCVDNGRIIVDDLLYWEDNSMTGSTYYDGSLALCNNCTRNDNIIINQGLIYLGNRLNYLDNSRTEKINVKYITTKELSNTNYKAFPFFDKNVEYDYKLVSDSTTTYQMIGVIKVHSHGCCKFNISGNGGQSFDIIATKKWDKDTLEFKGQLVGGNHEIYYKYEDGYYEIYAKITSGITFNIKSYFMYGVKLLNVNNLMNTNMCIFTFNKKQSDLSGLTQITIT